MLADPYICVNSYVLMDYSPSYGMRFLASSMSDFLLDDIHFEFYHLEYLH